MNFDLKQISQRNAYKLLTGIVVPRPIAWVTSQDENGLLNVAPFSFFNMIGGNPPIVVLGVGNKSQDAPKDTARNIRSRHEFVVNMVSKELLGAMNISAVDFPAELSEIEVANLQTVPSTHVSVPRLEATPAALECREHTTLLIGENRVILAEVVAFYIRDEFVDLENHYVRSGQLDLIARMGGGGGYTDTSGSFELARISFEEWQAGVR